MIQNLKILIALNFDIWAILKSIFRQFRVLETLTRVRDSQPSKAQSPIDVTEGGMLIWVREVQYRNALSPIDVTEGGRLIWVSEMQNEKALLPIDVTEGGMLIWVREVQS